MIINSNLFESSWIFLGAVDLETIDSFSVKRNTEKWLKIFGPFH